MRSKRSCAFDFRIGGQTTRSGPGSFHFVPRGTPHSFNNAGDKPARMLILNQPAGLHETFFLEVVPLVDVRFGSKGHVSRLKEVVLPDNGGLWTNFEGASIEERFRDGVGH